MISKYQRKYPKNKLEISTIQTIFAEGLIKKKKTNYKNIRILIKS